jgi:hypothetical protein
MTRRTFHADTPLEALLLEQALLLARQLQSTADAAPDGQVLARVEAAAVPAGRELTRLAVEAALQGQAAVAEKKGPSAASAPAAGASAGTRAARRAAS